jgi:hypothetical protein
MAWLPWWASSVSPSGDVAGQMGGMYLGGSSADVDTSGIHHSSVWRIT